MSPRMPAVAGQFYPASPDDCRAQAAACLGARPMDGEPVALPSEVHLVGGIVPHAGWICSGAVAGEVVSRLAARQETDTFVIFGAAHRRIGPQAAVYARGGWDTPLGTAAVDEELAAAITTAGAPLQANADAHEDEHSIEVQVPLIQGASPGTRILPIVVPPMPGSPEVGRAVARAAERLGRRVVFLGSTDLTHYGPWYHFTPHGAGEEGVRWAKEVNDRRMLDLMVRMEAERIVPEAAASRNACGAGAVAATVAAAREAGATAGYLLRHTNSNETLRGRQRDTDNAVGYAGVVFGRDRRPAPAGT